MTDLFPLLLIVVCLGLEGLFSGGEIALISADIHKIRNRAAGGSRSALTALRLLEKPERFLATTLTGTNLCQVTSTAAATALFISMFGAARGELVSVIVMVPAILILGELIPKSLFQQRAEFIAVRISRFIRISSWLLFPLVYAIGKISRATVQIATGEKTTGGGLPIITKTGLKFLLARPDQGSDIRQAEREMVRRILDFSEVTVDRIMVPLSAMAALPVTATLGDAVQVISDRKYLRIPVYQDQIFNIIGMIHYFDLLETLGGEGIGKSGLSGEEAVASCLKPVGLYVPEAKPAKDLIVELRSRGERMAVVVDEYGGAVGIVTIEDIMAAIVGEIDDDYDSGTRLYRIVGPGRYLFNARISLEKVRQLIPMEIPEGDYESLGGFILHSMGKIPNKRETLRVGTVLFVIEDVEPKSVKEVLAIVSALPEGQAGLS
ncbi:MAG: HlyC/CorC family transporter [Deltaproteobacteria bacterium]|nr:HlyC/CorC family transporter [Deltaproteobacteria bacterium]